MYIKSLGAICSPKDVRDHKAVCTSFLRLPEEYECYIGEVKNQGQVGSCVAHSLAEVIEVFNHNQENNNTIMSTGYIYGNRRDSDHKETGMIMRDALKAVTNYGTTEYEMFPYNIEVPEAIKKFEDNEVRLSLHGYSNKISSYYSIISDSILKASLYNGDCVIFSMPWYDDIEVKNGILTTSQDKDKIGGYHCMVIYGWCKDGWLVQNSWGTGWGNKGRVILPYNIKRTETWGIKDTIGNIEAKAEWAQKASKKVDQYMDSIEKLKCTLDLFEYELSELRKGKGNRSENEIITDIDKVEGEIADLYDRMNILQDQIDSLDSDNIKIKKPFSSILGKVLAKIINYIFNLFKK